MSPRDIQGVVGDTLSKRRSRGDVKAVASSQDVGDGTLTKAEANYRDADTPEESCGTCANFDGHSTCKVVAGRISADHVSDEYKAKKGTSDTAPPDDMGTP